MRDLFRTWSAVMSAWGMASNVALFLLQYFIMNVIGRRRSEDWS
jgi:hypothetical protein